MNMMSDTQKPKLESSIIEIYGCVIKATYVRCGDSIVPCNRCAGNETLTEDTTRCPVCGDTVGDGGMRLICKCGVRLFRCRPNGGFRCIHESIIDFRSDDDEI